MTYSNFFPNKVVIQFYMLRTCMKHRIHRHIKSTNIVTKQVWRMRKWYSEITQKKMSQVTSAVVEAIERYSASELDLDRMLRSEPSSLDWSLRQPVGTCCSTQRWNPSLIVTIYSLQQALEYPPKVSAYGWKDTITCIDVWAPNACQTHLADEPINVAQATTTTGNPHTACLSLVRATNSRLTRHTPLFSRSPSSHPTIA